ncbi:hemin uptake protein HemP [Andreprevotia chitinilytica]|uniref:hemin uptake protein HemP n=1 Tax=Andreprevotia chitinilytica TaxID=396808 RepID=UPI000557ACB8|nr:hemin uptake protein HemP [Andreprevotia chitinilytica]
MDRHPTPSSPRPVDALSWPNQQVVLDSRTLLQSQSAVVIEHKGVRYTLRETRQGKLILTK